ncbi:uncharacterized protein LOC131035575 [Cryptomeria japonica]|uniref:uncharacterized protein LOC131035575 n=1 Tax=Cryptomeria japonica TaxID=3369 RepID=UPI0027DA274E|nr:uncharacterized protein LOC131035575 [Cryptomeria japonica]
MPNFWIDSWEGRPTLLDRQDIENIKQVTRIQWGEKVGDFLLKSRVQGVDMCEWKDVENLPLLANQKEMLKGIMQEYTPMLSAKEDTMRWCGSKSGQYLVKIGYNILDKMEERKEWPTKLMWSSPILPKAGVFACLALKKRILTGERLRRLGFLGPFRCIMCKKAEESLDHLLLQCEEAQMVWSFLLGKLGWMAPLPNTVLDLFSS